MNEAKEKEEEARGNIFLFPFQGLKICITHVSDSGEWKPSQKERRIKK